MSYLCQNGTIFHHFFEIRPNNKKKQIKFYIEIYESVGLVGSELDYYVYLLVGGVCSYFERFFFWKREAYVMVT